MKVPSSIFMLIMASIAIVSCGDNSGVGNAESGGSIQAPTTVPVKADPPENNMAASIIRRGENVAAYTRASDPLTDLNELRPDGAAADNLVNAQALLYLLGDNWTNSQEVATFMENCLFDRNPELQLCVVHRDNAERVIASGGARIQWVKRDNENAKELSEEN